MFLLVAASRFFRLTTEDLLNSVVEPFLKLFCNLFMFARCLKFSLINLSEHFVNQYTYVWISKDYL